MRRWLGMPNNKTCRDCLECLNLFLQRHTCSLDRLRELFGLLTCNPEPALNFYLRLHNNKNRTEQPANQEGPEQQTMARIRQGKIFRESNISSFPLAFAGQIRKDY